MSAYVYIQSETAAENGTDWPLYTVGFYKPDGKWEPESDYGGESGKRDAAARVAWLNGSGAEQDDFMRAVEVFRP